MRRTTRIVSAMAALALAVTACGGGQVRGAAKPDGSSPPGAASPSGPFVYSHNLDIVTDWNPATSSSNEIIALQNIYETLTKYNPATQKAEPRLATSWTAAEDGKTWTFTLRPGVKFHSGKPLDAAAVKAAIEHTVQKKGYAAYIWSAVDKIETPDASTVKFTLKYPTPLDVVASAGYGAYIYDPTVDFEAGKADGGSGPYTIDTWQKGRETELTLKAFDGYWGGWDGPHYKQMQFRVVPEETTTWQLLQRGEINFANRLGPQLFAQAKGAGLQTSETPSFQNLLVLFNTETVDVKVRKALQKAIDYDGLVAATKGAAVAASGLVPEGLLGHAAGMTPKQDLAGAETLLKEAGFGPGGKPLELSMTYAQGDEDQQLLGTLLATALKKLNVELTLTPLNWNTQWEQGKKGKQDVFVMYWYPDYADAYSWFANVFRSADPVSFNLSYLADKELDAQIDALPELAATDRAKAEAAYADLQKKIIDEQAAVAVPFVQRYRRAFSGGVEGYVDNPAYPNVVFAYDLKPGK
ncbi:ABC transporter substrate-binding protein [Nonomuraea sp. NPDC050328]|uniref:ABC transporter substrate-binding protein n=1 Tax=Nonomuraea sp. NPDC050328 TaxID=3364361 RepID=UPI0037B2BC4E